MIREESSAKTNKVERDSEETKSSFKDLPAQMCKTQNDNATWGKNFRLILL